MWTRLHKKGHGAFNCEIWYSDEGKYWIKIYIYGKIVELTGDYETLNRKLNEFSVLWNNMVDTLDLIEEVQNPHKHKSHKDR